MAGTGAGCWMSSENMTGNCKNYMFPLASKTRDNSIRSSAKRNQLPFLKTGSKKRLIRISTAEGRRDGEWSTNYNLSWQQLQLQDLLSMEGSFNNSPISITLYVQKHTGFGLSVEGRVMTCFTAKCCNCCTPFLRQIDSTFKAWVLPSKLSTKRKDPTDQLVPEIGVDDPSVIYVKPGCEANLDSLVQDTVRLAISVQETCSDSCDKSQSNYFLYLGGRNAASVDRRWYRLLELKNTQA